MNKKYKICLISLVLCFTSAQATSLRESVEKTLSNNPSIISEHFNRDAYKKYVDQEEADYLPTLDFEIFAEKSKTKNSPDETPPSRGWSEKDGWNGILKLEHTLYDGGLTPSEAAEYRYKFYGNNYRSSNEVENIVLDTVNAYIDLVSTQELMALSKNNIKIHEEYLTVAKEKEEISGEILETYQVNSKYHSVLDRYLEQENEKDQALSLYKKLVGEELDDNICRPVLDERFIPSSLEEAIEFGLRRNYRIKEQIEKIKEQREKIVQAQSAFRPTILFQLQSEWDNDLELEENGRQDIYRARIFMSWNLFEGGKSHHITQKEQIFLKEEQKRLDEITNEVVDEIKSVYRTYQNYKKRIDNMKLYVDDNYNILKVYKKQLADGTRTFLDILNAESELYRSDIDKIEQEIELIKSYYQLLFSMSSLSDTILMHQNQTCPKYEFVPRVDDSIKQNKNEELSEDLLDLFSEGLDNENNNSEQSMEDSQEKKDLSQGADEKTVDISSRLKSIYGDEKKIEDKVKTDKDEVLQKSEPFFGKYTLNMGNFKTMEGVKTFIDKYSLDKTHYYRWGTNGENIKLLYGSFDSVKSAKEAMKQIDKKALSLGAYVDNMKKHKNLEIKYQDFN